MNRYLHTERSNSAYLQNNASRAINKKLLRLHLSDLKIDNGKDQLLVTDANQKKALENLGKRFFAVYDDQNWKEKKDAIMPFIDGISRYVNCWNKGGSTFPNRTTSAEGVMKFQYYEGESEFCQDGGTYSFFTTKYYLIICDYTDILERYHIVDENDKRRTSWDEVIAQNQYDSEEFMNAVKNIWGFTGNMEGFDCKIFFMGTNHLMLVDPFGVEGIFALYTDSEWD